MVRKNIAEGLPLFDWCTVRFIITCLLTYLLHEQSPSWEAGRSSASQEIPHILWNPEVYYRIYKFAPPVPILNQINPVHGPHSTFWRSNQTLSFCLSQGIPSGLFPLGFPT
jgi:hypothetical protein